MTRTGRIAQLFKELTYDEMVEIAQRFSDWTGYDEDGDRQDEFVIASPEMCSNLSEWADEILSDLDHQEETE